MTLQQKLQAIKLVIFDVDGVLTDGKLYFTADGDVMKTFHSQDGIGMKQLLKNNIEIAIITGRNSPIVSKRMQELGIKHVYQGVENKILTYNKLLSQLNLTDSQVAYMGDDTPDFDVMQRSGVAITVANAMPTIKQIADYQTQHYGGKGAAREACDLILAAIKSVSQATV